MEWNTDSRRIFRGRVNSLPYLGARRGSINVVQLLAKQMIEDRFELGLSMYFESTKENRSHLADFPLHRLGMLANPFHQTNASDCGSNIEGD